MPETTDDTGRIAKSAGAVSVAVMCSRVLGLVREQAFAVLFGAGFAYDAYVVAFRIPNLFRDLFGEGALSAAFVSVFADYDANRGKAETWKLANNVLVFFAVLLSLLTIAGVVFAEPLVHLLVDAEFTQVAGKVELTRRLTVIMFPFLVLVSLAAVVMGILNTRGRFFIPSLSSAFFNIGSIIGGVSLSFILPYFGYPAIMGMAIGTLIGGFLQLSGQIPVLRKTGFRFRPRLDLKHPGLKRIVLLMVPAVVGLSATQFNVFINTRFASSCMEGSLSWLNYAFRLVQLPIGVVGVAISIAALPVVSRYASVGNFTGLRDSLSSSLVMAFCLSLPASVGLWFLAEPIIQVIFEHGAFSAQDTARTATALQWYSVGLFAYASVKIMVPVFYALKDTRIPVAGSFLAVGANLLFVTLLIDTLSYKAIAVSTSAAMVINFLFLGVVLYIKLTGLKVGHILREVGKMLCACLIMGLWLYSFNSWGWEWFDQGIFSEVAGLFLSIGPAIVLYGGVLYLLRVRELTLLVDKVKARLIKD
ncbi:MAG: murein biosynthesis integral membrane protein MurJ [Desulfurivibrionaceae bacterium]